MTTMAKKLHRVPVRLDATGVECLSPDELKAILRGADDLIMRGGRNLLAQVLKGSRRKRLLELGLDESPVFGYYRDLDEKRILARIDWVILEGYLEIEYDYRLPLLVYTRRGWEIEKVTYAEELLRDFDRALETDQKEFDVEKLKDRNRELIWLLLDKVQATRSPKYIPLLEAWAKIDYKKVKRRIGEIIQGMDKSAV